MGKLFGFIVGVAGIVGAVFAVLQYYSTSPIPAPSPQAPVAVPAPPHPVPQAPTNAPPPALDFTPDPATAAVTKVMFAANTVLYSVTNLGWADDMRNVDYSLWAVVDGALRKVEARHATFIAKGEYAASEYVPVPFRVGKMVVCVSYEFKKRRVNVIDFYTNEDTSSFQRKIGETKKFRESLSQVDGSNDICKSMPTSVAGLI